MRKANPPPNRPRPSRATKESPGRRFFHEMLINDHKVEVIFGYPGGAILPVFDAFYKTPAKFILNRHEQGRRALRRRLLPGHGKDRRRASSPAAPAPPTPSPRWPPPNWIPSPSSFSAARWPPR